MSISNKQHITFVDTKKLCRLCLKENLNFGFSLMDIDGRPNENLLRQIYDCTTLKISVNENYPPTICSPCYAKLEEHTKFKESVLKNDEILTELVDKQNNLPQISKQNDLVIYDPENDEVLSPDDIVRKISRKTKRNVEEKEILKTPVKSSSTVGPKDKQECPICHKEFRNAYTLRRHINLHTEENLHECEYCHKKFNDRSNYRIHLRMHTGNDLYRCVVCYKQFISPSTLKYHVVIHKKRSNFKCRICSQEFNEYVKLESHFHDKHSEIDFGQSTNNDEMEVLMPGDLLQIQMDEEDCEIIDEQQQSELKLKPLDEEEIGDEAEHVPDDDIQIIMEPGAVPIEPNKPTNGEIIELDADKIMLFRCDYCMEIFNYYNDLRAHMKMHETDVSKKCNECNKAFKSEELLKVHQAMHAAEELQMCKHCGRLFKSVLNLENHFKKCIRYDEDEPVPLSSEENSPRTTSDDELYRRICDDTSLLTRNTLKRCEICAQIFDNMIDLEKHVAIHLEKREGITFLPHETERPYRCNECNKSFKRKDYLLIHIRTHTGERRYKCNLCSSAFVHPSNLITHRKLHSNERPFSCDLCGATFKLFAGLKIHRKRCVPKYSRSLIKQ